MANNSMIMTAAAKMTAPLPNTPVLLLRGDRKPITSDNFSGPSGERLLGRLSNAAAGGTPMVWECSTGTPMIELDGAGVARATTANGAYFYYFDLEAAANRQMEIGVRIVETFSVNFFIDLFRVQTSTDRKIRVILKPDGAGEFTYTAPSGEGSGVIPGGVFTYKAGDRIRAAYNTKTGLAQLWVNDLLTVNNPSYFPPAEVRSATRFGLAGTTTTSGKIDDFTLTETLI